MRSDMVFGAVKQISNRFLLARALAKATRKFHRPGTRVQDTTNAVLARFGYGNSIVREDIVPVATNNPTRRNSPPRAIRQQSKRLSIPTVLDGPGSLPKASQLSRN
jgi:hypothetical protein